MTAPRIPHDLPKLTVVSVVRDVAFYQRCVRDNPALAGATFVMYDNRAENCPIAARYNAFLETMPNDAEWIFFAHEDMALLEDPRPHLRQCDSLFPYGIIGTRTVFNCFILPFGDVEGCHRDGTARRRCNPIPFLGKLLGTEVEAFDCCGFFVHAACFRNWKLCFDEACAWDLYAEDLCYQFQCATGHRARTLPVKACHWSWGDTSRNSFLTALAHLNAKYANRFFAGGTCVATVGGVRPPLRMRLWRKFVRRCFFWRFRR